MKFDEMCGLIKTHVNRLVSDRQIAYILKCLSQIGMVRQHVQDNMYMYII